MKEYEGFVKMTTKEFKAKETQAMFYGKDKKFYAKGDLTHYNGNIYISIVDGNGNSPADSSWKRVFIED